MKYVSGDLFSVKSGVLAHACNCHGVWGGGIALGFLSRFPAAYKAYQKHCLSHTPKQLLGTCLLVPEGKYQIACMFTSDGSTHEEVAKYTAQSALDLQRQLPPHTTVYMPMINAGIFGVPWEYTSEALSQSQLDITVYRL